MKTKMVKTQTAALTVAIAAVGCSLWTTGGAFALDTQADDDSAAIMVVEPDAQADTQSDTWSGPMLTAQAGRPGEFPPPHMWAMKSEEMKAEHRREFIAKLNITDAQIEKLAQLKSDFKDKAEPIKVKLHALRRQCHRMLLQDQIDPDAIAKVRAQMEAQRKLLDGYLTDYLISKAQVLTPEQRHKIELAMDKRELWHHGCGHHESHGFHGGFHGHEGAWS